MYDAKNTSAAHTQTAAQNQLIMAAKVAYDILFITTLQTGISVTPSIVYGKDQLNLQGVHTPCNRWHELLENDRKHSNITCRAELDVGPRARERTVERNSMLDPKGLRPYVMHHFPNLQLLFNCKHTFYSGADPDLFKRNIRNMSNTIRV